MDAKKLLTYALNKMTPDQANELLSQSRLVFRVAGTEARFENGKLVDAEGREISASMGAVTGVSTGQPRTLADGEAGEGERVIPEGKLGPVQNHTLPGSGETRSLRPVKGEPGMMQVVETSPDEFGKRENTASGGKATAGFHVPNPSGGPESTSPQPATSAEEARRIVEELRRRQEGESQPESDESEGENRQD